MKPQTSSTKDAILSNNTVVTSSAPTAAGKAPVSGRGASSSASTTAAAASGAPLTINPTATPATGGGDTGVRKFSLAKSPHAGSLNATGGPSPQQPFVAANNFRNGPPAFSGPGAGGPGGNIPKRVRSTPPAPQEGGGFRTNQFIPHKSNTSGRGGSGEISQQQQQQFFQQQQQQQQQQQLQQQQLAGGAGGPAAQQAAFQVMGSQQGGGRGGKGGRGGGRGGGGGPMVMQQGGPGGGGRGGLRSRGGGRSGRGRGGGPMSMGGPGGQLPYSVGGPGGGPLRGMPGGGNVHQQQYMQQQQFAHHTHLMNMQQQHPQGQHQNVGLRQVTGDGGPGGIGGPGGMVGVPPNLQHLSLQQQHLHQQQLQQQGGYPGQNMPFNPNMQQPGHPGQPQYNLMRPPPQAHLGGGGGITNRLNTITSVHGVAVPVPTLAAGGAASSSSATPRAAPTPPQPAAKKQMEIIDPTTGKPIDFTAVKAPSKAASAAREKEQVALAAAAQQLGGPMAMPVHAMPLTAKPVMPTHGTQQQHAAAAAKDFAGSAQKLAGVVVPPSSSALQISNPDTGSPLKLGTTPTAGAQQFDFKKSDGQQQQQQQQQQQEQNGVTTAVPVTKKPLLSLAPTGSTPASTPSPTDAAKPKARKPIMQLGAAPGAAAIAPTKAMRKVAAVKTTPAAAAATSSSSSMPKTSEPSSTSSSSSTSSVTPSTTAYKPPIPQEEQLSEAEQAAAAAAAKQALRDEKQPPEDSPSSRIIEQYSDTCKKIRFSRGTLQWLRRLYTEKPEDFPSHIAGIDASQQRSSSPRHGDKGRRDGKGSNQQWERGVSQPRDDRRGGRQGQGSRNGQGAQRGPQGPMPKFGGRVVRDRSGRIIQQPMNLGYIQPLDNSETRWQSTASSDDELAKLRKTIQSFLNKLTLDKFDVLSHQMLEVMSRDIQTVPLLREVVAMIFDKAVGEAYFASMYADLCFFLQNELEPLTEEFFKTEGSDEIVLMRMDFRRILLNQCQEEFDKGRMEIERDPDMSEQDFEFALTKQKNRMLGNIRFIGELYKKSLILEKIMHECIIHLLSNVSNPADDDLVSVCKLLTTIGSKLDHPKAAQYMQSYFSRLKLVSTNERVSTRIRFMCMDLIELREKNWRSSRTKEAPKTIEEIHKENAREEAAKNMRSRGGRGGGGGGRRVVRRDRDDRGGPQDVRRGNRRDTHRDDRSSGRRERGNRYDDFKGDAKKTTPRSSDGWQKAGDSRRGDRRDDRRDDRSSSSRSSSSSSSKSSSSSSAMPVETIVKKSKSLVNEYISVLDIKEAIMCVEELIHPDAHAIIVAAVVVVSLEKNAAQRETVNKMLIAMHEKKVLSSKDLGDGFARACTQFSEIAEDLPVADARMSEMIAALVAADVMSLSWLTTLTADMIDDFGTKLCTHIAKAITAAKSADFLQQVLDADNIQLKDYGVSL